ncbi:hypothetical protein H4582DRAFT_2058302 [Lactarius indigo]|nr:hypothetical protein H4582DRAFT_2058302 [Lactarius indigo]
MFSDPVDDSPSDTQSFDEDDMYGSDGDVETISLKPLLEHVSEEQETSSINQCVADVEHPLEEQESSLNEYEVDMDIISDSENIHRSVNDFSLMGFTLGLVSDLKIIEDAQNTFTIPMGDVVEVVNQTRKTKWGLRTTVKEVPFHLKKGKSGQASMSQTGVETTMETVQLQSSRDSPHGIEESHTLHHIEPYEPDLQDFQAEESQPQQNTNEPVDRHAEQIHPPVARDGGSDKCSKLLYVYQFNADQVLRLYWRKVLLQGMLPSNTYAIPIPSDVPLNWHTLCTNVINVNWI